jgi:chromosome condensin MukBEF complex kleisin-like MukF subunit
MQKSTRALVRREMDEAQRGFRMALKRGGDHHHWLREVRQALKFPVAEMARALDVNRSVIFRMERREQCKRITLEALDRAARTMRCRVVYAIVPIEGTLEELAEQNAWKKRLRDRG